MILQVWLFYIAERACTYPTRWLSKPQSQFEDVAISREFLFLSFIILWLSSGLLAAILRVRTQELVCGRKGNTRIKFFELCQTRVKGKNEPRMHIMRFSSTNKLSEQNNHKQVPGTQYSSMACNTINMISVEQLNTVSDDVSKLPSRRRQGIIAFPFGSALEPSILDKQTVSSNTRLCCFRLFCFPAVCWLEFSCPCIFYLFFSAVLLYYCCCTIVRT